MRDSAYLAALVRAHVAASPPLAADELAALKLAVTVIAGFGRLLARTAREATQAGAMARICNRTSAAREHWWRPWSSARTI